MEQVDVFAAGDDGVNTYRIPSLLATPGGALLAFCEARKQSRDDATPTDLVFKRSTDGGRTWSPMRVLVEGPGNEAIMNPTAVVHRESGAVILFCNHVRGHGQSRQRRQMLLTSTDDGATWSKPASLSERIVPHEQSLVPGPGVGIQTAGGRLVVPGYAGEYDPKTDGGYHSRVIYSGDGGKTWRMGRAVSAFTNESQVVELADGRLMLNMRDSTGKGRRAVAFSEDKGETWSEVSYSEELNECACQASIIRLSGGPGAKAGEKNRLLFSNPDNVGRICGAVPRTKLTVRISYDEGRTWPVKKLIHAGPSAYSGLVRLPDGDIGVVSEGGKKDYREWIRFVRFSLDWLEADAGK